MAVALGAVAMLLAACSQTRTYESPPWAPAATVTGVPIVSTALPAVEANPRQLWPEAVTPEPTPAPARDLVLPSSPAPGRAIAAGSIEALICSYPWPCGEALYIADNESGFSPYAVNPYSGACGLFQLLPCACIDPACNVEYAYRVKWLPTRSFYDHWLRWWN